MGLLFRLHDSGRHRSLGWACFFLVGVSAFSGIRLPRRSGRRTFSTGPLSICSVPVLREGVEIPILDVLDSPEYLDEYVQPLPSTHLPDEMTSLHLYGMRVAVPVHQSICEYAVDHAKDWIEDGIERTFGFLAWKPDDGSLVGAIGCAAEILPAPDGGFLQTPLDAPRTPSTGVGGILAQYLACRGTYRFVIREIKQSFPFPVAVVDELPDTAVVAAEETASTKTDDDEEDDDDDEPVYTSLSPNELVHRTMSAMQAYVDQELEAVSQGLSPLELSIVEQSGSFSSVAAQKRAAEEMAAVWDVFLQYLVDLCPAPSERCFSIGFMAAEIGDIKNEVRRKILQTTSGVERLAIVLRHLETAVDMTRARKVASAISQEVNEIEGDDPQDLQVGQPSLPPWASAIRKGMRLEYFWNEDFDWCGGTVLDEPVWVVYEYLLKIQFDDGEVHLLPFSAGTCPTDNRVRSHPSIISHLVIFSLADDKARWRPARPSDSE